MKGGFVSSIGSSEMVCELKKRRRKDVRKVGSCQVFLARVMRGETRILAIDKRETKPHKCSSIIPFDACGTKSKS